MAQLAVNRITKEARLNHEVIKRAVKGSGLTEEEMAEVLVITDKHLRNLMRVDSNVLLGLFYKITLYFDVPISDIIIIYEETELYP